MTPELRSAFERRVLSGESIAVVATDTPYSTSAAQRHVRLHLNHEQAVVMRSLDSASLHVHEFGQRFLALADEASEIRCETSDPRVQLAAIHEEAAVLTALVTKLGIDSSEAVEVQRESRVLAMTVSSVLAQHPDVAAALSRELTSHGEHDLARAFGRLAAPRLREVGA